MSVSEEGLSIYLAPRGQAPGVGHEIGRKVSNGIARYVSEHGSVRYVLCSASRPLAVLQVVTADGVQATISNVFTVKSARRRGLAKKLLDRARSEFVSVTHADESMLSDDAKAGRKKVG